MMVLTGISHESDFMDGTSQYFLIFNKGEFRLAVPEDTAVAAVERLSSEAMQSQVSPPTNYEGTLVAEQFEPNAEIFSAAPADVHSDYDFPPDHDVTESDDDEEGVDDGIGQI